MLLLKALESIKLALFLTGRPSHFLLALIEHHLLDHGPGLAVEVAELAVLGRDLGGVDLVGGVGDDAGPPFQLVALVQMDADFFGGGAARRGGGGCAGGRRCGFEGPCAFVHEDGVRERVLDGLG